MALFAGLMSGTSMDGVDGVLAHFDEHSQRPGAVLAHASRPMPDALALELLALNSRDGRDELHRAALAGQALMQLYAEVVQDLLAAAGRTPADVVALGAHGQTVRHQPQPPTHAHAHAHALAHPHSGYTLQLANGALLAELTGIDTVCDFRAADVAAGGQGAPLVPAFHAACLSDPAGDVAVLNVGGVANLTLLPAAGAVGGFDTGPGNLLMDLWCAQTGGGRYDRDGAIAAAGRVQPALLQQMLAEPYFALPAPKSTGRDLFHAEWLQRQLQAAGLADAAESAAAGSATQADVMATLAELTARSVVEALQAALPGARRLIVCGGGAKNGALMRRWQQLLPGVAVLDSAAVGLPSDQVEALAFAWLAACRIARRPASLPAVTGARGARVLGAVYPAPGRD